MATDARRRQLLDALSDHLLSAGLSGSSLRPMAKAAGTSDRMLLYYFPSKDALIAATLGHVAARMMGLLDAHRAPGRMPPDALFDHFRTLALAEPFRPYRALFLEIASHAARGDAFSRQIGHQLGQSFLNWMATQIDAPTEAEQLETATRLLTLVEGFIFLHAIGIEGSA